MATDLGGGTYMLNHCQYCEAELTLREFNQYYIKDENQKVMGVAVRCLRKDCNDVPKYYELIGADLVK